MCVLTQYQGGKTSSMTLQLQMLVPINLGIVKGSTLTGSRKYFTMCFLIAHSNKYTDTALLLYMSSVLPQPSSWRMTYSTRWAMAAHLTRSSPNGMESRVHLSIIRKMMLLIPEAHVPIGSPKVRLSSVQSNCQKPKTYTSESIIQLAS